MTQLAARVYVCEVGGNGWSMLVDTLVKIIKEWKQEELIEPSIRILSGICDQLASGGPIEQADKTDGEAILGSLMLCAEDRKQNKEIRLTALKAVRLSTAFISSRIKHREVRDFVLDRLMYNIEIRDEDIVCMTYQVLIELIKSMYPYWGDYIQKLLRVSCSHIESKSPQVVILACEFWGSLASEETYRRVNMSVGSGDTERLPGGGEVQELHGQLLQRLHADDPDEHKLLRGAGERLQQLDLRRVCRLPLQGQRDCRRLDHYDVHRVHRQYSRVTQCA